MCNGVVVFDGECVVVFDGECVVVFDGECSGVHWRVCSVRCGVRRLGCRGTYV